ncbi:MAG: aldo/keto reductase [Verrucomicrobiales bacterium]|nr:aldo/keto reductase [Verrucomicrobiales bacterium]
MQTALIGTSSLRASRLAYGCWRIAGTAEPRDFDATHEARGREAVLAAVEAGYTLFDHADIYGQGLCESIFGRVLADVPGLRDRLLIATKCGIRRPNDVPGAPYRYDFSADYVIASCEGSLRRLGVETIDLYQLHRPDYLMEPDEVAGAFDALRRAGKVREFGVSNCSPSQVALLRKACPMPLVVNQVEISLARLSPFEDGTLEQCLAEGITPMAWSPLAGGKLGDGAKRLLPSQEGYRTEALNRELDAVARERGVTRTVVALAWLMRHPSRIVPIVGSVDPSRIREAARADALTLSREEWYRLLTAARSAPLP